MKLLSVLIIICISCFIITAQEPQRLEEPVEATEETEEQDEPKEPTRIELVNALTMEFDKRIGADARRVIGAVTFKHDDAYMHCDSAYLYSEDNSVEAFSNIHIEVGDTINIYGNKLYYDGNTSIAELHGDVKMQDKQMTLTTEQLTYNINENTAKYYDSGKIVDEENVLTSKLGVYYADRKHFFFKENVELVNPDYTMDSDTLKYNTHNEVAHFFGPTSIISDENEIFCRNGWYDTKNDIAQFSHDAYLHNEEQSITGDSLFYDRNKGYGKAIKNVKITDTVQNAIISGHFGEHFENEGLSIVTEEAMLTITSDTDSLFMHADTLKYVFKDKPEKEEVEKPLTASIDNNDSLENQTIREITGEIEESTDSTNNATNEDLNDINEINKEEKGEQEEIRKLLAYNHGKFYRTDLQGISDSIVYNFKDSIIHMYHEPILWSEEHQLTADKIEVETWDNNVKQVNMNDAAFIVSKEDTDNFNQIKGRRIVGHFNNNQLYKMDVFGNGETIYYVRDEDEELVGVNKSISSNMTIFVEGNQVNEIIFREDPEADLYPPEDIPEEERLLRNFEWLIDIRPKSKKDIFVWH